MNVVTYARTSGTGDGENSFEVQEARAAAFAAREGHEVVGAMRDENVCGAVPLDERSGLLEAMIAVQDGRADGLVLSCIDRFARELHIQEAALRLLWQIGEHVTVFEYDRGELLRDDPEDPYRTFIRQVMGAATQLERGMIVRRLSHGKRRKAAAGGYVGGYVPFGYDVVDGEYVRDEPEQAVIARAAQLRSAPMSWRGVALALTQEGGGVWHYSTVRNILTREGLA
jgi:DNA invertase Pin-like site-specific DNA recombinase